MAYDRQASWQNPRVLGLLLLVFLVGAAVGAVVIRTAYPRSSGAHPSGGLVTDKSKEMTLQHFKQELNLTPAQSQQIEVVLDDFLKYMQVLQDQMEDTRATGKQRILRILNDDQKIRFEKMMSDLQKPGK